MKRFIYKVATFGAVAGGFLYALKLVLFVARKQNLPTINELIDL
jgi:hypothetical protein